MPKLRSLIARYWIVQVARVKFKTINYRFESGGGLRRVDSLAFVKFNGAYILCHMTRPYDLVR